MFSELNDPARQPSVYASLPSLARSQARLEAGMDSLLLFRRALSSPTMCRFIPALSVPVSPVPVSPFPVSPVCGLTVNELIQLTQDLWVFATGFNGLCKASPITAG